MIRMHRLTQWIAVASIMFLFTGCSFVFHKRSPADARKIDELESEVSRLNRELDALDAIKRNLEGRLSSEISRGEVGVEVGDRGLVISSTSEVYFDSGKAKIRSEAEGVLKKISAALKEVGGGRKISVEGHTDNQPIKYSGWKSNQELSEARAGSVGNFLKKEGVSSSLLSTSGYGESHPVASNDTKEGRQKNRRVEIIILSRENLKKTPSGHHRYEESIK